MLKIIALIGILLTLSTQAASNIRVSAASSLTDVLSIIVKKYEKKSSTKVIMNFDASSRLARQIAQGAPADVFLSADRSWSDYLKQKKMVREITELLANSLVVIAPVKSKLTLTKLGELNELKFNFMALAHETVPAGKYASEALRSTGAFEKLKNKIVSGDNVRQVLAWVAKDEADLGIVFKTDALVDKNVKQLMTISSDQHSSIVYTLTLLSSKTEAKAFFDYLSSPECQTIFTNAGFMVIANGN